MSQDTSHNKYILLRQGNIWTYIFGEGKNTLKCFETERNIDRKYGITYCRKLKKKRSFLENEKWQTENSETSEISEISEILFRVFLFPSFRFCPIAKTENSDLKISEKNFLFFWDFRVFRVFDLTHWDVLWSWIYEQMEEVVRARNPFHLTQV